MIDTRMSQDSRVVQKDINQLTEKANRIFLETDEMIFKNAKKDEQSRRAYKLLASLHETCENIIKIVEGTGHNLRESRELEEQIEAEQKKNMAESLGRISNDLKMIKKENKGMLETLKSWVGGLVTLTQSDVDIVLTVLCVLYI